MKKMLVLLIALAVLPSVANARKFVTTKDGKEVVAHTSLAPVLVHKILPPYGLGRHVYAGKLSSTTPAKSESPSQTQPQASSKG
jgi:hypothetical protein